MNIFRILFSQTIVVALIGCFISVAAHYFVEGIKFFESLRKEDFYTIEIYGFSINFLIPTLLIFSYILVLFLRHFGDVKKWESPADIIYCAQNQRNELPPKTGLLTILASFVSLAGGAPLGQYGPLVHLGGTFGLLLSRWYRSLWLKRDVIVGCCIAAAISAGFNAPIAGIIFAHEAVLRHFSARAIALISIASISASALNQTLFETFLIFEITEKFTFKSEMVVASLISGVVCGMSAILIIRSLFFVNKINSISKKISICLSVFGMMYLLALSQFLPEVLGLGIGVINNLISEVKTFEMLTILLIAKLTAVVLSANIGFSGGFVGPALFVGALLGALLTHLAAAFGFFTLDVMLIIAGAASVAGTVFGAPLAMVILVLELTNSYDLTIAAMLSIVMASLVFHLLYGHSLFDLQLLVRGVDLTKGRIFLELESTKIASLATDEALIFLPETKGKKIFEEMKKYEKTEAYCVTKDEIFIGKLAIFDVVTNKNKSALDLANSNCLKLFHSQSINDAIKIAANFVGEGIPIINENNHRFLGIVSESHLFEEYLSVADKVREIETA